MTKPCPGQDNGATANPQELQGVDQTGAEVCRSDEREVYFGACHGCPWEYGCDSYCARRDGRRAK